MHAGDLDTLTAFEFAPDVFAGRGGQSGKPRLLRLRQIKHRHRQAGYFRKAMLCKYGCHHLFFTQSQILDHHQPDLVLTCIGINHLKHGDEKGLLVSIIQRGIKTDMAPLRQSRAKTQKIKPQQPVIDTGDVIGQITQRPLQTGIEAIRQRKERCQCHHPPCAFYSHSLRTLFGCGMGRGVIMPRLRLALKAAIPI